MCTWNKGNRARMCHIRNIFTQEFMLLRNWIIFYNCGCEFMQPAVCNSLYFPAFQWNLLCLSTCVRSFSVTQCLFIESPTFRYISTSPWLPPHVICSVFEMTSYQFSTTTAKSQSFLCFFIEKSLVGLIKSNLIH